MISLFKPRLPIDSDELEFQLATFKWLLAEFGSPSDFALVLPKRENFPGLAAGEGDRVRSIFDDVRRLAGMDDWPCELAEGEVDRPTYVGNATLLQHDGGSAPCGTFELREGTDGRFAVISYNPGLAGDPEALIATFAHEFAHYLLATAGSVPPGGYDLHELHTDLAAVYLGFGIFLANSARNFHQFQSAGEAGWSARTQGYLSEGALVTALIIRERLARQDPLAAASFLKPYLRSDLDRAVRALTRSHPDIASAVNEVDLGQY